MFSKERKRSKNLSDLISQADMKRCAQIGLRKLTPDVSILSLYLEFQTKNNVFNTEDYIFSSYHRDTQTFDKRIL